MNLLFSATSGWGKSFHAQGFMEANVEEYDRLLVLDYSDEYRGLVKGGLARHFIVGPDELAAFDAAAWSALVEQNPQLVVARHNLTDEDWREACAALIRAGGDTGDSLLVVVDEAHFVAPQGTGYPHQIKQLATTGRGERRSAMWVTQRLAELDETVIGNSTARMLGGYTSENDTKKLRDVLPYPSIAHMAGGREVPGLPEALHAEDEGAISVRKFTEGDRVVGSEWFWSDESGELDREDTRDLGDRMRTTHYGAQGKPIRRP